MLPSDSKFRCWYETIEENIRKDHVLPFWCIQKPVNSIAFLQLLFSKEQFLESMSHDACLSFVGHHQNKNHNRYIVYIKCISLSLKNKNHRNVLY